MTRRPCIRSATRWRGKAIGIAGLALLSACATRAAEQSAASFQPASYERALNGGADELSGLLAPGFTDRSAFAPRDAAAFVQEVRLWREIAGDLRYEIVETVVQERRAVVRLRLRGEPQNRAGWAPVSGGAIAAERTEWLKLDAQGRILERRATYDETSLPPERAFTPPPVLPYRPQEADILARFEQGTHLESIAISPSGALFVSTADKGEILKVDASGAAVVFFKLPAAPRTMMMCLAFAADGVLFATVFSGDPALNGIWRIDAKGRGARIAAAPLGSALNGIALDGRGGVLAADSFGGVIWRAPMTGGELNVWLRDPLLASDPLISRFPGANGLQRRGSEVFVTNPDRGLVLRIDMNRDASAAAPKIVRARLPADDFAIAANGDLIIATHPFNSVLRLRPNGQVETLAAAAEHAVGATSVAIGRSGEIYFVTDGGAMKPAPGLQQQPALVRLSAP